MNFGTFRQAMIVPCSRCFSASLHLSRARGARVYMEDDQASPAPWMGRHHLREVKVTEDNYCYAKRGGDHGRQRIGPPAPDLGGPAEPPRQTTMRAREMAAEECAEHTSDVERRREDGEHLRTVRGVGQLRCEDLHERPARIKADCARISANGRKDTVSTYTCRARI
jgi:hypothetical protein